MSLSQAKQSALVGILGAALCATPALASEGPWTTLPGKHNIYTGLFYERFECFTLEGGNDPSCGSGAAAIPDPVQRVGMKLFYRTGLTRTLDVAAAVPIIRAASSNTESDDLAPTTGIGLVQARIRWRMGALGPIDIASGAALETGALHRQTRGRITNLGDGVTSAIGTLYAGTTRPLGARFYTASTDLGYAFRIPELEADIGRLPGDELRFSSVFLYALTSSIGIGASLDGQVRLWGEPLDFAELAAYSGTEDSIRWAVLDASQIKAGGRVALYPTGGRPYLQLSMHRAVWARNNPIDTTIFELAAGFDIDQRR